MCRQRITRLLCISLTTVVLAACGAPKSNAPTEPEPVSVDASSEAPAEPLPPAAAPRSPEELMKCWLEVAQTATNTTYSAECREITEELAKHGPEALQPLLTIIGDKEQEPRIRVIAVTCLQGLVKPAMVDTLKQLTAADQEATTRACATHLLGSLPTKEVLDFLRTLTDDPERRVRFSALRGLASAWDDAGREGLAKYFDDPEVTQEEREEIGVVFGISIKEDPLTLKVLSRVVQDMEITPSTRKLAIGVLGHMGDASVIPALESAAQNETDKDNAELAASAAEAIKERLEKTNPAPAGAGS